MRVVWCNHCRRMVYPGAMIKDGEDLKSSKAIPICSSCGCVLMSALEDEE